ncbi:MAG: gluconate 2-dehydrogenase subunit 3 family protein [Verrucomicrobiae bacterium]|nr:gluconate 2-dehydrogenase subunit 3 family protein [Verrucomicrobiae bacterium]
MSAYSSHRLSRREVIKRFAAASAMMTAGGLESVTTGAAAAPASGQGYGTDPDLMKVYEAGDVWPLTLSETQRTTTTALADVILPADDLGPAASEVGVPEFIDEWVSAPYPEQQNDRPVILEGLEWIEKESVARFGAPFAKLTPEQQAALCDDICDPTHAKPEFKNAARFFQRFRGIASGGYYCTEAGWKAIGFVGNLATPTFDGPPPEVLERLGVEQTVG